MDHQRKARLQFVDKRAAGMSTTFALAATPLSIHLQLLDRQDHSTSYPMSKDTSIREITRFFSPALAQRLFGLL